MSKKTPGHIDCACVIHGTGYDWQYVERLYNMLCRNLNKEVRMHVYTEHDRSVPPHMIKHILEDWGFGGPKRSWWYKMQLFNTEFHAGPLLYFDLDCVIARDISWVFDCDPKQFWAIRDFKQLQNANTQTLNSSVMWWDTREFADVWKNFSQSNINDTIKKFPGDQDYLTQTISYNRRRFFDDHQFESYRWQVLDGGYDFVRRRHKTPGSGSQITDRTSVIVFHGKPKPHQVTDKLVQSLWV
jgi:hypothetical protein